MPQHTATQNFRKTQNDLKNKAKDVRTHKNKLGYIDPTIAGIDIGANVIHVAIANQDGGVDVEEFGTTTPALKQIGKRLQDAKVITAVMEATGVYWIPLYEILEDMGLTPALVDAKAVKNVPGRKTDVHDAQWIQTLYSNGMVRPAFRPPRSRLALRAFVRQRQNVIKTRSRVLAHMEKALQLMNIKLSGALSDIGGISGLDIIRAIVGGERDPEKLANLRNIQCKKSQEDFVAALSGNFQKEHLLSLKQALDGYDFAEKQLNECDQYIKEELELLPTVTEEPLPPREKDKKANGKYAKKQKPKKNTYAFDIPELLWRKSGVDATVLDGIGDNSALVLFAELGGTDVSAWATEKEFCSWLKLCPGNNISGGKRRKSKKQPCANYMSQTFRLAALAAKKSNSAMGAKIRGICGRADKAVGIKAGAHYLAMFYYNMCKHGWTYYRKGAEDYEKAHSQRRLASIKRAARSMGFELTPTPAAA